MTCKNTLHLFLYFCTFQNSWVFCFTLPWNDVWWIVRSCWKIVGKNPMLQPRSIHLKYKLIMFKHYFHGAFICGYIQYQQTFDPIGSHLHYLTPAWCEVRVRLERSRSDPSAVYYHVCSSVCQLITGKHDKKEQIWQIVKFWESFLR